MSAGDRRTPSSRRWLARQQRDPYVVQARRAGYRSRAAFKLAELDDRFGFLRPGGRVLDLGAAPGGWAQVAAERVAAKSGQGVVVAVDLLAMPPLPGVSVLTLDVSLPASESAIRQALGGAADVVLSDMAPNASGHAGVDHLRIVALVEQAAELAWRLLRPGGVFVAKVRQGGAEGDLLRRLKHAFASVRHAKPKASRAESAEVYLVAQGFRPAREGEPAT